MSLFLTGCTDAPKEQVLFDFESDSELDQFEWKCHTLFSLSDEHVTHGKHSLKLSLFPPGYAGLHSLTERRNWRAFRNFCFDVYNAERESLMLSVRIDDEKAYPDYKDRYNQGFHIGPGMNQVCIPIDSMATSGTQRKIDAGNIYRFLIFTMPAKEILLYLDNIRLIP